MLNIQHLTKTYGEKKAVDDLSLHIAPGEIYGFIGHNGAGKTTTLKSVVGILRFDSGSITIDGISVQDDPIACKSKIAYIPDHLKPLLSVTDRDSKKVTLLPKITFA